MLTLSGVTFQIDNQTRDTAFFLDSDGDKLRVAIDISCEPSIFEGEDVTPRLSINYFDTKASQLEELVGECFTIKAVEEAKEREDTFCLYEHEPFMAFSLMILAVSDKTVHTKCIGLAVTDGYADPPKTAPFEFDCWLPVIRGSSDWAALGL